MNANILMGYLKVLLRRASEVGDLVVRSYHLLHQPLHILKSSLILWVDFHNFDIDFLLLDRLNLIDISEIHVNINSPFMIRQGSIDH